MLLRGAGEGGSGGSSGSEHLLPVVFVQPVRDSIGPGDAAASVGGEPDDVLGEPRDSAEVGEEAERCGEISRACGSKENGQAPCVRCVDAKHTEAEGGVEEWGESHLP